MKTFSFAHLPPLRDFQFLTDSSGFVLTQTGQLYRFTGQQTALVVTPSAFTVSHFHFLDQTHGAVIGAVRPGPLPLHKSAFSAASWPVLVLLWLIWRTSRHTPRTRQLLLSLSVLLLGGSWLLACSPAWQRYRTADPTSPHASYLIAPPLHRKNFHSYLANKGQATFIARTQDQGRSWDTQPIPTNFFLTALTALGQNYLVGTYANEQGGTIPLHGDGDVYIYGTDASLTKELAANSPQHPYGLSLSRGVKGFFTSVRDSTLFIFGSDRMPSFPSTAASATAGNIYALPMTLQPKVRLLDAPDTVDVLSLAQSGTGELWVTLADRKPHLSHGTLDYVALPTKKLLRFTKGRWQAGPLAPEISCQQVAFVAGTARGYVLTAQGDVWETHTNGEAWQRLSVRGVQLLHPYHQAITWLAAGNQVVYYQPPLKE
ncbi:MAG: hypothetical protein EOO62_04380 [Hymenobacter sp.]|nr:MAG: hypothetical protein EOO62_04380 [Hymenobacter sp.]